jgi:uncharacterized repeat protein (TIGR02543 family)
MKTHTLAILLLTALCSGNAFADGTFNINTETGDGSGWTFSSPTLTIDASGTYAITGDGVATANRIVVASGVIANITLSGVRIEVSATEDACAFDMSGATVTLALAGTNTLTSGKYKAGLQAPFGATLTIAGSGALNATGGVSGAGIGGGNNEAGGTVTIDGGTITANGDFGAGIGGGNSGAGGAVVINGGTVTTTSTNGAGIGGGNNGTGSDVVINGGTVAITSVSGAAIGGGTGKIGSGSVIIAGGSVSLSNHNGPYPTGDGATPVYLNTLTVGSSANADRTITAGSIGGIACDTENIPPAAGHYGLHDVKTDAAGIVYCYLPSTTSVEKVQLAISGAGYKNNYTRASNHSNAKILHEHDLVVTGDHANDPDYVYWNGNILTFRKSNAGGYAIAMNDGADVPSVTETIQVSADGSNAYAITLQDVSIDASATTDACAFDMSGATVNLTLAGTNTLISGMNKAGLQAPSGATLAIAGSGSLNATGGGNGAGIGGGGGNSGGGNITINGSTITATGSADCAGIGGSNSGAGGNVVITGGTITAIGGNNAAAIGDGNGGAGGNVVITGGSVYMNNHNGPQPTNDGATPVYLNTLTVGSSANAYMPVTAGNIDFITCADIADADAGVYGIKDVKTDAAGKVYFYLPATGDVQPVMLKISDTYYSEIFQRAAVHAATTVTLTAKTHALALNRTTPYSFPDATYGYATAPAALAVKALNMGNAAATFNISLSGDGADAFTLSVAALTSIHPAGIGDFTVVPKTGLDAGTHTATVTVAVAGQSVSKAFNVSFKVALLAVYDYRDGSRRDTVFMTAPGLLADTLHPARANYTFDGWYKQPACTEPWNFAVDAVTGNLTLYAQWLIHVTVELRDGNNNVVASPEARVLFYRIGSGEVEAYDTERVAFGSYLAVLPAGNYFVRAENAPGCLTTYYDAATLGVTRWYETDALAITDGDGGLTITIRMAPTPEIETGSVAINGHVYEENGKLKARVARNASVGIYYSKKSKPTSKRFEPDLGEWTLVRTVAPDEDAYYVVQNLPPGRYLIVADIPGYELIDSHEIDASGVVGSVVFSGYNFTVYNETQTISIVEVIDAKPLQNDVIFAIYPNPFKSEVYITGAAGCTLTVFTATGTAVHSRKIAAQKETVVLKERPAGLYFFRVSFNNGKTKTVKIIKN